MSSSSSSISSSSSSSLSSSSLSSSSSSSSSSGSSQGISSSSSSSESSYITNWSPRLYQNVQDVFLTRTRTLSEFPADYQEILRNSYRFSGKSYPVYHTLDSSSSSSSWRKKKEEKRACIQNKRMYNGPRIELRSMNYRTKRLARLSARLPLWGRKPMTVVLRKSGTTPIPGARSKEDCDE